MDKQVQQVEKVNVNFSIPKRAKQELKEISHGNMSWTISQLIHEAWVSEHQQRSN